MECFHKAHRWWLGPPAMWGGEWWNSRCWEYLEGKKPNLLLRCNYKRTQIANFSKLCRYRYVGLILLLHCVAFDNGHKRNDVYFAHKKDIRIIISIAIFRATRNYTYIYLFFHRRNKRTSMYIVNWIVRVHCQLKRVLHCQLKSTLRFDAGNPGSNPGGAEETIFGSVFICLRSFKPREDKIWLWSSQYRDCEQTRLV